MAKWTAGAIVLLVLMLALAGTVSAHVSVSPNETKQGAYEVFTVRVPTEQQSETTRIELLFPEGVAISRVLPQPGWSYAFSTDAEGGKSSIVWTAEGAGLKDGEFGEFKLQGKVADDAQQLVWKAVQTYANGSVVEWAGGAEAETPASITAVLPGTGEADHHGAAAVSQPHASAESGGGSGITSSSSGLLQSPAFYVSVAALSAGVLALFLTLRIYDRKQTAL
ncbi:YcnI family copper-binding membrane protein [Paenibacillus kobensis]|uniref:YcnI family copper-binding membrane protein n=1 Tax=Paenibacillus kobensis TaxID=59841 RepID=UPI000FD858A9|nr:YcnI family protein [Paenibacillus kobensis]